MKDNWRVNQKRRDQRPPCFQPSLLRISNDRVDLQKYFSLRLRQMLWYVRAANGCIALRLRGSHRRHHCQQKRDDTVIKAHLSETLSAKLLVILHRGAGKHILNVPHQASRWAFLKDINPLLLLAVGRVG